MSTEILIIDDNADIRNIINDLIIDAGYIFETWQNPKLKMERNSTIFICGFPLLLQKLVLG